MKLLEAIEGHLGEIDNWPSYILRYIFGDHPSPLASIRLRKVIAFFFGNDIPCALACMFSQACNMTAFRCVGEQFHEWYYVWQRSKYKTHMAEYYNMRLRKHIYINDSYWNQLETVLPEVLVLDFGIDNTRCRRRLI